MTSNPYEGPGDGGTIQAQWHDGEGRPCNITISDDEYGRRVVDLPGVMVLYPTRTLGGVLALTREAVTALRDALNQLPLPPL